MCPHWKSLAISRDLVLLSECILPEDGTCCSKHGSKEKLILRWTGNLGSSLWREQIIPNFLLLIPSWIYLDSLDCKLQVKNRKTALTLFASVFSFISCCGFLLFPLSIAKFLYDSGQWGGTEFLKTVDGWRTP